MTVYYHQGNARGVFAVLLVGILFGMAVFVGGLCSGVALAANGTLRVGTSTEPPTLDPQLDAGGPASEIQENIFETLVSFNSDMELVPLLAEGWDVSDDGTQYTFRLRQGIVFHDGTPFNAEAVQFTFLRAMGKIDGRQSRYITLMTQLQSVEVVDDYTVVFQLDSPYAPFINNLAHLGYAILSPTAVQGTGDAFGRAPVGTGPFRIGEWRTGRDITIARNPNYWQPGLPLLDSVVFRYIPDASTRLVTLESGEIDLALAVPEADFGFLARSPRFKTYQANTLRTVFLMFNPLAEPFTDSAVRQAVIESVDREGIAAALLEGLHAPAIRPTFAPGVWGVSDAITPYNYDVRHAAQLLEDAGWRRGADGIRVKDGKRLQFTIYVTQNRYPKDSEIGAYLRSALAQALGADVRLATFEWETYRNNIFANELELFMFGAGVSTGDIDYVATILFHSSGSYNQAPTSVEKEIIEAQSVSDPSERLALYEYIQEEIAGEHIWLPLYWQSLLHASNLNVENFIPHPMEKVSFAEVGIK